MQTKNNLSADVYTLYHDKVFGYVLNRVHNRYDAEDITSEVFLKIYSVSGGFDPQRKGAASYIFRAMQTTLVDFYRKSEIRCAPQEELADISEEEDLDDALEELDSALDTLTEREREVVILYYYHGLSHKEISEKMHLSYTNVRQLCHISIKKLRKVMKERSD